MWETEILEIWRPEMNKTEILLSEAKNNKNKKLIGTEKKKWKKVRIQKKQGKQSGDEKKEQIILDNSENRKWRTERKLGYKWRALRTEEGKKGRDYMESEVRLVLLKESINWFKYDIFTKPTWNLYWLRSKLACDTE